MAETEKVRDGQLPFSGQLFEAEVRKYEEIIFFVHFYGGNKRILSRHIEVVNELGFDAYAFNLEGQIHDLKLPISANGSFGMKHVYADQIEMGLNQLNRNKIIFSFSNPSASAIEAMFRRNCTDIKALICDSGPCGSNFFKSTAHFLFQKEKSKLSASKFPLQYSKFQLYGFLLSPLCSIAWSPYLHSDTQKQLESFPNHFPILSIRGWKDQVIPIQDIDSVFEAHANLDWQKLSLPEAGHLNGLRDFPEDYLPPLTRFLERVSTA